MDRGGNCNPTICQILKKFVSDGELLVNVTPGVEVCRSCECCFELRQFKRETGFYLSDSLLEHRAGSLDDSQETVAEKSG